MAIPAPAVADTSGPLGDSIPRVFSVLDKNSGPRYLFLRDRKPRHTYVLHDRLAYTILVWIY